MSAKRHDNNGLRKICDCPRRNWPKCSHDWHFNFKPRGGQPWRFSLDVELGRRIASKGDAEREAARIRAEILAGTFVRASDRRKAAHTAPTTPDAITLEAFAAIYLARVSQVRERNKSWTNDRYMFAQLAAFALRDGSRLGDKALGALTEDDLEAFAVSLRAKGRAASTRNQYVQLLKASCRWATKKGYLARNPLTEDSALTRTKIAQRGRRLVPDGIDERGQVVTPGDERRLLGAASVRLLRVIIAAIETCCRRGELLSLQWREVNLVRGELTIRAYHAKDAETRVLPISARLAAVLEMARTDPAGQPYPPDAYVFGDGGRRMKSLKRAWATTVLRAHGYRPVWMHGSLAPASRAQLDMIDLHFHDLRHEGASRLL